MALDWNKEVSFSSIVNLVTRGKKGEAATTTDYPTKTWMNLYQVESKKTNVRTIVLASVLALLCIVAVVKFGVIDQFAVVHVKEAELERQQQALLEVSSQGAEYTEVRELYEGYQLRYGSGDIDVIDVLDLIERQVKPAAKVSAITFSDTTLTLTLRDVTLDTVGILSQQLRDQDIVESVYVSTAQAEGRATGSAEKTSATLVITLVSNDEEAGE